MSSNHPRVVVIGAGWNGLSVAKTYLQVQPNVNLIVLESEDSLGGTWSLSRIYPTLSTQQPYGQYSAADFPLTKPPEEPVQPGNFTPSSTIHNYLEAYAKEFGVFGKIRFNAKVDHVTRMPKKDGGWRIQLEGGENLIADKLVVATGLTSLPSLPSIPATNFTPLIFHSKYLGQHYSRLKSPETQIVTVYGGGKSAFDAANAAWLSGKTVHWVIRTDGEGMAPMIDAESLKGGSANSAYIPKMSGIQPDPLNNTGFSYRFFHSGRNRIGYNLLWWFWGLASNALLGKWGYDSHEEMRKLRPDNLDRAMFWCTPAPFPVPQSPGKPSLIDAIRNKDRVTVHRASITSLGISTSTTSNTPGTKKTVHLSDGISLETDILIYATGYSTHQPIFSVKDSHTLGLPVPTAELPSLEADFDAYSRHQGAMEEEVLNTFPRLREHPSQGWKPSYTLPRLYRYILPLKCLGEDDRSIAFVGYLQGAAISVIADVSSLWAVGWLTGQLNVLKGNGGKRSLEEVEREVDWLNAFTRKRWGKRGGGIPSALLEWMSSTEEMLKELDCPLPNVPRWKPWLPPAYKGLVGKWVGVKAANK